MPLPISHMAHNLPIFKPAEKSRRAFPICPPTKKSSGAFWSLALVHSPLVFTFFFDTIKKGHGDLNHGLFYSSTYLVYPSSPALAESTTVGAGATSEESTTAGAGSGSFSPQNVASVLT